MPPSPLNWKGHEGRRTQCFRLSATIALVLLYRNSTTATLDLSKISSRERLIDYNAIMTKGDWIVWRWVADRPARGYHPFENSAREGGRTRFPSLHPLHPLHTHTVAHCHRSAAAWDSYARSGIWHWGALYWPMRTWTVHSGLIHHFIQTL